MQLILISVYVVAAVVAAGMFYGQALHKADMAASSKGAAAAYGVYLLAVLLAPLVFLVMLTRLAVRPRGSGALSCHRCECSHPGDSPR